MSDVTPAPAPFDTKEQMSTDISAALNEVLGPEGAMPSETPAEAVATEVAATPDAPPAETAAAPTTPALADDTPIEIVVDGVPTTITLKEARENGMRHAAFTKKTQALATERKVIEAQAAEAAVWKERGQQALTETERFKAEVRTWLSDPNKLGALYLAAQRGEISPAAAPQSSAPVAAPINPQELAATVEAQVIARLQQESRDAALVNEVETFTGALIADDPTLSVLGQPFLDSVYQKVGTMGARDVEEFKQYVRMEIEDTKARLSATNANASKVAAVAKQQAATGIQRGGSPLAAPKKEYTNFEDMKPDIGAMLDNLLSASR